MKNVTNSLIFYFTSFVAAVSGAILFILATQVLLVKLSVHDPKHFKMIEFSSSYDRELVLSDKAFASALFKEDLDQDPKKIKEKSRVEREIRLPKLLKAQALKEEKVLIKWGFTLVWIIAASFSLSRFFGRINSRSDPRFIDKNTIGHIMAIILILYASVRLGIWGFNVVDRYWQEEIELTEESLKDTISSTISKIEHIRTSPDLTQKDLDLLKKCLEKSIYYTYYTKDTHLFVNAEILSLQNQNWSLSKLHKILAPLVTYMESQDWQRIDQLVSQNKNPIISIDEIKSQIKKMEKFYAQDDFYTPVQTDFLIDQHNEHVQSLSHLISAISSFLFGAGLLLLGRRKSNKATVV